MYTEFMPSGKVPRSKIHRSYLWFSQKHERKTNDFDFKTDQFIHLL